MKKDFGVNSLKEANDFWINMFGDPVSFSRYDDLLDVEEKIIDLKNENDTLNKEIQSRDVSKMNEYKINRAIELHFLINAGDKYFSECGKQVELHELVLEPEYENSYIPYDPYREDGLFDQEHNGK